MMEPAEPAPTTITSYFIIALPFGSDCGFGPDDTGGII